jgi:hypothetical protein
MSKLRTIIERDGHTFAVKREGNLEILHVDGVEVGVAFERTDFYHTVMAPRGAMRWFTRKQDRFGSYTITDLREIPDTSLKSAVEDFACRYCRELKTKAAKVEVVETAIATYCFEEGDEPAQADIGYDVAVTGEDARHIVETNEAMAPETFGVPALDLLAAYEAITGTEVVRQVSEAPDEIVQAASLYGGRVLPESEAHDYVLRDSTEIVGGFHIDAKDCILALDMRFTHYAVGGFGVIVAVSACYGDIHFIAFPTEDEAVTFASAFVHFDAPLADRGDIVDAEDDEAAAFPLERDRFLDEDEQIGERTIISEREIHEIISEAGPRHPDATPEPVAQRDVGIYIHLRDDALMWQGQPRRRAPLYLRTA